MPKFSVVIPVYNKRPHIERSINSVLEQTNTDFELILIDDASTDGSSEKLKEFSNNSKIRLFSRDEPGPGGYAARNLGIKEAKGEWIAFLDADDTWYPNHLEKFEELISAHPELYFVGSGWQTLRSNKLRENAYYAKNKRNANQIISLVEYLDNSLSNKGPVWTSVACIKKNSPVAIGLFPASSGAKRGGDLHAWLKLICYHKKMGWSNHIGAIYHLDSVNMVTKTTPTSTELFGKEIFKTLSENLNKKEKKLLSKYLNKRLYNSTLNLVKYSHRKSYFENILWEGNYFNGLVIAFKILIPFSLRRILSNIKRGVKKTF